jgi:hypothetical protein
MIDEKIKLILGSNALKKHEKLSQIVKYLFVDIANISQKKYFLLGSYALRKHRNISDVDINLDHDEFFKLKVLTDKGFGEVQIYSNAIRWFFDMTKEYNQLNDANEADCSIETFQRISTGGFPNDDFSLNNLKKIKGLNTDENGHQYFSLKTLLKWKQTMNRPKDQVDIEMIQNIMENKKNQ